MKTAKNNNTATKDDIKAIRGDLQKLEKDLRHDMGTMDKKMGTMDKKIDRLTIDALNTHTRLQKIEETMATKDDINKVLNAVDTVMDQYQKIKIEQLSNLAAHDRFQADITKLKVHTGLPV